MEYFCAPRGIYITCVFSYTVDTGGGDGAANFTQLDPITPNQASMFELLI